MWPQPNQPFEMRASVSLQQKSNHSRAEGKTTMRSMSSSTRSTLPLESSPCSCPYLRKAISVPMIGHHSASLPVAWFMASSTSHQPLRMSSATAARRSRRFPPKEGSKSHGVGAMVMSVSRPNLLKLSQTQGSMPQTQERLAANQGSSMALISARSSASTLSRAASRTGRPQRPCGPLPRAAASMSLAMATNSAASLRGGPMMASGVSEEAMGSRAMMTCSARSRKERPTAAGQSSALCSRS
mmetsp:Transcript_12670/g.38184  ORF Transcript_12670/g.38184 Transcript_12670/m.38184 type:complete len:242 (-) Transcript_12670:356-1081(-)